jgi:predicted DNA-binding protein YlxM (UPF0122 family)
MEDKVKSRYVTIGAYAELCNVSRQAIMERINRGTLPVELREKTVIVKRIDLWENPPQNKSLNPSRPKRGPYKKKEKSQSIIN